MQHFYYPAMDTVAGTSYYNGSVVPEPRYPDYHPTASPQSSSSHIVGHPNSERFAHFPYHSQQQQQHPYRGSSSPGAAASDSRYFRYVQHVEPAMYGGGQLPPTTSSNRDDFSAVLHDISQDLANDPLLNRNAAHHHHPPYGGPAYYSGGPPPTAAVNSVVTIDDADSAYWELDAAYGMGGAATLLNPWNGNPAALDTLYFRGGPSISATAVPDQSPPGIVPPLDILLASPNHPRTTQPPTPVAGPPPPTSMQVRSDANFLNRPSVYCRDPPQQLEPWAAWEQEGSDNPTEIPYTRRLPPSLEIPPSKAIGGAAVAAAPASHHSSPRSSALKSPLNPRRRESPAQVTLPPEGFDAPQSSPGHTGNSSLRGESAPIATDVSLGAYDAPQPHQTAATAAPTNTANGTHEHGGAKLAPAWSVVSMPSVDFSLTDGLTSRRASQLPKHGSLDDMFGGSSTSNKGGGQSPMNLNGTSAPVYVPLPPPLQTTVTGTATSVGQEASPRGESHQATHAATVPSIDRARNRKLLLNFAKAQQQRPVPTESSAAVVKEEGDGATAVDVKPNNVDGAQSATTTTLVSNTDGSPPDIAPRPPSAVGAPDESPSQTPSTKPLPMPRRRRGSGFVTQALDPSSFVRDPFAIEGTGPLSTTVLAQPPTHLHQFTCISVQAATERPASSSGDGSNNRTRRECVNLNMDALPVAFGDMDTHDAKPSRGRRVCVIVLIVLSVICLLGAIVGILYWQKLIAFS